MEIVVYNPSKGRLETIESTMTAENTTWFDELHSSAGIDSITDVGENLLIQEASFNYPLLVTGMSRSSIDHDYRKAMELVNQNR